LSSIDSCDIASVLSDFSDFVETNVAHYYDFVLSRFIAFALPSNSPREDPTESMVKRSLSGGSAFKPTPRVRVLSANAMDANRFAFQHLDIPIDIVALRQPEP
jgi:hypothetical protein